MSMPVTSPLVAGNIKAAANLLAAVSADLPAVRYGGIPGAGSEPAVFSNAAKAAQAVRDALVGFTWVMRDRVDFSDGVWSDKAGQSDVARAARLLDRSSSLVSGLANDLAGILAQRTPDKVGITPVYNDFGDGGVPLAAYWAPALERTQSDLATALEVLGTVPG